MRQWSKNNNQEPILKLGAKFAPFFVSRCLMKTFWTRMFRGAQAFGLGAGPKKAGEKDNLDLEPL